MNLDSITLRKSHKYFNQEINFRLTLKLPEAIRSSTFIIKKLKTRILIQNLKNWETEVSLKQFLKKPIESGNLHHLPLRMLKVFLVILDNFN